MQENNELINGLESLSKDILTLNFAAQSVLIIVVALFLAALALLFWHSYYKNTLIARSAGKNKRLPIVFVSISESLGSIASNAMLLPILIGVIAAAGMVIGVTRTISSVNAFIEREKQIKTLSIAINFLNQSDKALDVRVRSVENNVITLRLDYKASDPNDTSVPPVEWTKTVSIEGTEVHIDCMVFNFSYSEVGSGRQRNIAIPYRIFSNKIAAVDGIKIFEDNLIPEEDSYGFIPSIYREQLVKLLTDAEFAREMGIRSVNGSDVWRANIKVGDRFRINVEQTGGLTLEHVVFGGN
jgi:hypothetical protein